MLGDRAHRAAVPALTALGLALLVWAATTGPARIIGTPQAGFAPRRPPPHVVRPSQSPSGQAPAHLKRVFHGPHHLSWVGDLLSWTVLLLIVLGAVAGLVWLWRHRWRRPARPPVVDVDVLPTVEVAESLARSSVERLSAVGRGSPRNGIVECWLLLEEAIADAGMPRLPWETSTEFTVRVLHRLDIDPRATGTLAGLYREARFSEHPMGEEARAGARQSLQRLDEDLRSLRAAAPRGMGS